MFQSEKKIKNEPHQPMLDQNDFLNEISAMLKEEAEMKEEIKSRKSRISK